MPGVPSVFARLAARFDPEAFDAPTGRARLRLEVSDEDSFDAIVEGDELRLEPADPERRADARLAADHATWRAMTKDLRGGMRAFRSGRLTIRDNLHLGVGFLAATGGFGDSVKPLGAAYDPRFFAGAVAGFLDACGIESAHLIGEELVRRFAPGGRDGWSAVGVDEFLRAYLTPRGRAAFNAALRNIYLDEPEGPEGFWTRLRELQSDSLFVWGRDDRLVPIGFARHVRDTLPGAEHVELDCGHVPQLEAPRETHTAIKQFLAVGAAAASA
jgi:pimeloyl-ACP methyl ester carboxylesterase